MSQMPYDIPGDPELAHAWAATADERDDTWITAIDDPYLPIHYPTVNLLGFEVSGEYSFADYNTVALKAGLSIN